MHLEYGVYTYSPPSLCFLILASYLECEYKKKPEGWFTKLIAKYKKGVELLQKKKNLPCVSGWLQ